MRECLADGLKINIRRSCLLNHWGYKTPHLGGYIYIILDILNSKCVIKLPKKMNIESSISESSRIDNNLPVSTSRRRSIKCTSLSQKTQNCEEQLYFENIIFMTGGFFFLMRNSVHVSTEYISQLKTRVTSYSCKGAWMFYRQRNCYLGINFFFWKKNNPPKISRFCIG